MREASIKLDGKTCCWPTTSGLCPRSPVRGGNWVRTEPARGSLGSAIRLLYRDILRWPLRRHNSNPHPVDHFTLPTHIYSKIPTPCVSNIEEPSLRFLVSGREHIHAGMNVVRLVSGGSRDDHK